MKLKIGNSILKILIALLIFVSAGEMKADPRSAQDLFYQGSQKDLVGDFQRALVSYRLFLKNNPRDLDTLKRAAYCCTKLGILDEALLYYDRYLQMQPADKAIAKRAEEIRRRMSRGKPKGRFDEDDEPRLGRIVKPKKIREAHTYRYAPSGFSIQMEGSLLFNSEADFDQVYVAPSATSSGNPYGQGIQATGISGFGDLKIGWLLTNGLGVAGGLEELDRYRDYGYGGDNPEKNLYYSVAHFNDRQTFVYVQPSFRYGERWALIGSMKLGYGMDMITSNQFNANSSGVVIVPGLQLEFVMSQHFAFDLGLEYRFSRHSPVQSQSTTLQVEQSGRLGDWVLDSGGPAVVTEVKYYFSNVRNEVSAPKQALP